MAQFKKVCIIGVGLIGGSIGLAIKKHRAARTVVGVFRRASTLRNALRRKAVDTGTLSIKEGVKDADLIILAGPVHIIVETANEAVKFAKNGAIVTDAGSTKSWIVNKLDGLRQRSGRQIFFVGAHPMAGSERSGVLFAQADLFEGTPCIVTKTGKTDTRALAKVIKFWRSLGSRVEVMTPGRHDRSVSLISHLPHIVAFSLAGAVNQGELKYAAEGFRDTTRVASSDPSLWADIFLTNRIEIGKACRAFEGYYHDISKAIARGDYKKTVRLLKGAKAKRDKFINAK